MAHIVQYRIQITLQGEKHRPKLSKHQQFGAVIYMAKKDEFLIVMQIIVSDRKMHKKVDSIYPYFIFLEMYE